MTFRSRASCARDESRGSDVARSIGLLIVRASAPDREQVTRSQTIREAQSAFRDDPKSSKLTTERAYIDCALRDAGLAKLSTEETAAFSVAV